MIPVLVAHAKYLTERVPHMERQLGRENIPFEWVTAYDPPEITPDVIARYFSPAYKHSVNKRSCALKHITAMQLIVERNYDRALVLEDDVFLTKNFRQKLEAILKEAEGWPRPHVIHIGCGVNKFVDVNELKPGQLLYPAPFGRTNEGYILGAQEARNRLDWIEKNKLLIAMDETMNRVDPLVNRQILWSEPTLLRQGSLSGEFTSELTPRKRPRPVMIAHFFMQHLKRRYAYRWLGKSAEQFKDRTD